MLIEESHLRDATTPSTVLNTYGFMSSDKGTNKKVLPFLFAGSIPCNSKILEDMKYSIVDSPAMFGSLGLRFFLSF
jgi:hypothetical protein